MKRISLRLISLTLVAFMLFAMLPVMGASAAEITSESAGVKILPAPKDAPYNIKTAYTGGNTFAPPVADITPAEGTPMIYDYTKTAGAGESMAVIGENLDESTHFLVYGQTSLSNGVLLYAQSVYIDDNNKATIILPTTGEGLSKWATYFVWAVNSKGASYPMIVNGTETWWVGPDEVVAGETTAVFGRNLVKDNNINGSKYGAVVLVGADGVEHKAAVDIYGAKQNKINFTVPDDLAIGEYDVYATNFQGGAYGWSKCPKKLKVVKKINWEASTINVKDEGAKGNGTTDDAAAIQKAMDKAAGLAKTDDDEYATVFFPEGTYAIGARLAVPSNIRINGAGRDLSTIKAINTKDITIMVDLDSKQNVTINNICIDATTMKTEPGFESHNCAFQNKTYDFGAVNLFNTNHIWVDGIKILAKQNNGPFAMPFDKNGYIVRGITGNHIYLNNMDITARGYIGYETEQLFITNSTHAAIGDTEEIIDLWTTRETAIENYLGKDKNPDYQTAYTQDVHHYEFAQRFIRLNNVWGQNDNVYIGECTAQNITPHIDSWMAGNAGEVILFESACGKQLGPVLEVVDNTTIKVQGGLQVAYEEKIKDALAKGIINIVKGTGCGQYRHVSGYKYDSTTKIGTITVSEPWDRLPDNTSVLAASLGVSNTAIFNNKISGDGDYLTRTSASTGVSVFCQANNLIVANNSFEQLITGVSYWSIYGEESSTKEFGVNQNVLFANNTFTNTRNGIATIAFGDWSSGTNDLPDNGYIGFGAIFRGNTLSNLTEGGIYISGCRSTEANMIVENNKITNCPRGISVGPYNGNSAIMNVMIKGNTVTKGAVAGSRYPDPKDDYGISLTATASNARSFVINNTFNGFTNTVVGSNTLTISPKLGSFYRQLGRNAASDKDANTAGINTSATLYNMEASNINYTASTDTSWITLGATSDSIIAFSKKDLNFTIDDSALPVGISTGTIKLKSGMMTNKTITVEYYKAPTAEQDIVDYAAAALVWQKICGRNAFGMEKVTEDLNLINTVDTVPGATIAWSSSDTNAVAISGTIGTIGTVSGNKNVKLTATITSGSKTTTKEFDLTIIGETVTIGVPDNVINGATGTFTATPSVPGTKLTWSSSNPSVIEVNADTGVWTAKAVGTTTITVTTAGSATDSKTVTVVAVGDVTLGDVNGDTKITIVDALAIFKHISGKTLLTGNALIAADCNKDSKVTILDALAIFKHISGKEPLV